VRLEQADHDGLGTGFNQLAGGLTHFVFTQRNDDLALHVGTLGHAAGARHRHQRLVVAVGVQVNAVFQRVAQVALQRAAHRVDLLEALVADQADVEALAHQDAVQHRGAGIHAGHQFRIHVINFAAPVRQRVNRRVVDRQGFVAGIALCLANHEASVSTDKEGVGHGAAAHQYPAPGF
jgi:hypothetical protein